MDKPAFFVLESESLAELLSTANDALKAVKLRLVSYERCVNYVTAIMEGFIADCNKAKNIIGSNSNVRLFVIEEPDEVLRQMLLLKTEGTNYQ